MPHTSISVLLRLLALAIFASANSSVHATSYYVNSLTGLNSNPGTSSATPWQDFTNINVRTFVAGDQILLARGATWTQKMVLQGSGNSTSWITVDAYGSGNAPKLIGDGTQTSTNYNIKLTNGSYWVFQNIEFTASISGIWAEYSTTGNQGLRFYNLYGHDAPAPTAETWFPHVVFVIVPAPSSTPGTYSIRDIEVANVETYKYGGAYFAGGTIGASTYYYWSIKDVVLRNCYMHSDYAGPGGKNTSNYFLFDNKIDANQILYKSTGTTSMFFWNDKDIQVSNNLIRYTAETGSHDETGIDIESWDDSIKVRGNWFSDNAGSAIEFLALSGRVGDFNTNSDVSSNTFFNNDAGSSPTIGGMWRYSETSASFTGTAANNIHYEPKGFTGISGSGSTANWNAWVFTNNKSISSTNIYNRGDDFSWGVQGGNQWYYQGYNGSAYVDMTYSNGIWSDGVGGTIAQFNLGAPNNGGRWAANGWKAPMAGTVSIRGRVLMNLAGGDGTKVRITKNGAVIWPTSGTPQTIAAGDRNGYATDLDNVAVAANDMVRFEANMNANNTNDTISWIPTVAYTASAPVGNKYDFGTSASPVQTSYFQVTETTPYATGGFGWTNVAGNASRDRATGTDLQRDFVFNSAARIFRIDGLSGVYDVNVVQGDAVGPHDNMVIKANGVIKASGVTSAAGQYVSSTFQVAVSGSLDLEFSDGGGTDVNWVVNAVEVSLAASTGAFLESGGKVSIEAETATENSANAYTTGRSSHVWSNVAGSSGSAMQVTPDNGSFWTDTTTLNTNSPEVTTRIKVATAGSYHVWLLVKATDGASDSIHVGLDDGYRLTNTTIPIGSWTWVNAGTISSVSAGYHDINLWAREDGAIVDKIYLTTGADTPTGTGPAQSARE